MQSGIKLLTALLAIALVLPATHASAAKRHRHAKAKPVLAAPQEPMAPDVSLNNLKDAPVAPKLLCEGPFARDTSHAKLATEFGAKNVAFKDVDGPKGTPVKATVLFDADPAKRIVIYWQDNDSRSKPSVIDISAPSTWHGPGGIRNGLPLKEMEKLNGGAFGVNGFGGKLSGTVSGLKGAFAGTAGGCTLTARLEPGIANPLPEKFAPITGDKVVPSSNPMMRRTRAQISEWRVTYP